jgi:creatinine amidohydrolase
MQWENLTSGAFAKAVRETGVCVIGMGVLERHSDHLPLGTDYLNAHRIACLAAEKEPAVVFPPFYFGQIYEARCFPGALTVRPTLLMDLIQSVLDEIGRNGFGKIILYNGHGGNTHLLRFLAQCTLWEQKPYSLYVPLHSMTPEQNAQWQQIRESTIGGHACEFETSMVMANYPDLPQMDAVPGESAAPLGRLRHLPPTHAGIGWYADYPEHYAGDARTASAEKGQALVGWMVETLAVYIAAVKADEVVPALEREFFEREARLREMKP